jgi:di/tripeptidase
LEDKFLQVLGDTKKGGVALDILPLGSRPGGELDPSHDLVQQAIEALQVVGHNTIKLDIGSTDANIPLSHGYPAICVGISRGGNAHSMEEYVEITPMEKGIAALSRLVEKNVWKAS